MKIIETTPDTTGFAQFEAALAQISPEQAHPAFSKKHFSKGYLLEHKDRYQARVALYQRC